MCNGLETCVTVDVDDVRTRRSLLHACFLLGSQCGTADCSFVACPCIADFAVKDGHSLPAKDSGTTIKELVSECINVIMLPRKIKSAKRRCFNHPSRSESTKY